MTKLVWLVGHDEPYKRELTSFLDASIECQRFDNPTLALASLNGRGKPDVVIADHNGSPQLLDGTQFLQNIPVVFTSRDPSFAIASEALRQGAVDFVTHDTPASLLAAKIKHRLESLGNTKCGLFNDSHIDNIYRKITNGTGRSAIFTSKEFQIVMAFARREPALISRNDLIMEVWGGVKVGQKTLDVHLFNIRKKIAIIHLEIRFEAPNSYRLCPLKTKSSSSRPIASHASNLA